MYESPTYDYVLVGGGLQNGLIALALLRARPAARIALVERGQTLGGNHTWCFHADDLPEDASEWVAPLVAQRWPGYEVWFPGLRRILGSPYAAITSEQFDRVVRERFARAPHAELWLGCEAKQIAEHEVALADGRRLCGGVVIDARGPEQSPTAARSTGYQKFVGLELRVRTPHGLRMPILMDATVPQLDGFRFLYVLPFGPNRVLIEDTRVSDSPFLDACSVAGEVLRYAAERRWAVEHVERQETGVLPLPWRADPAHARPHNRGPLAAGYQGGWFHPVTGYSFPLALRLALFVAREPAETLFGSRLAELARAERSRRAHCHFLNRMFFNWFEPEQRYHALQRFYRLPEPTIRRFYAMTFTAGDRARMLLGRPPRGISLRRVFGAQKRDS